MADIWVIDLGKVVVINSHDFIFADYEAMEQAEAVI